MSVGGWSHLCRTYCGAEGKTSTGFEGKVSETGADSEQAAATEDPFPVKVEG